MTAVAEPTTTSTRDSHLGAEVPLSVGATLTVAAAGRHASRCTTSAVTATHLLTAILERPDPRVKNHIAQLGADHARLCDDLIGAVSDARQTHGPELAEIVSRAREIGASEGAARIDDLCLLKAALGLPDSLSAEVIRSAGLGKTRASNAALGFVNEAAVSVPYPGAGSLHTDRAATVASAKRARIKRNLLALWNAIEVSPLFIALVSGVAIVGTALGTMQPGDHTRALVVAFIAGTYLISLCMHEFGHAAAAFLTGERRVKDQGYLTLDLRRYSNPLLTFVLPLFSLIAGRIPLPGGCVWIRPSMFRTAREDRFISAAGPAMNVVCVILLSIPLRFGLNQWEPLGMALAASATFQAGAVLFNLLPIPPLDGWQIYTAGNAPGLRAQAAALGFMPLIALFMLFRAVPQLSWAFWDTVDLTTRAFGIDAYAASYGMWLLSFR